MFEFDSPQNAPQDALFLERLEAFMDRSLADLRAFSERENVSFNETRLHVAAWHSKYLFQSSRTEVSPSDRQAYIHSTLCDVSRVIESLQAVSGVQAFVLAVDPCDSSMNGFLGGSLLGRDFWRTLRGGGEAGAKAFKTHCLKHPQEQTAASDLPVAEGSHQTPAQLLKAELYDKVRVLLRTASGNRTAEMKWTNPDRLVESYGVSLVGWPSSIPYQNPSSLKVSHRKELLQLLDNGTLRFVRAFADVQNETVPAGEDEDQDLSWALTFEDASSGPVSQRRSRTPDGSGLSQEELGPRKRPKTNNM